MTHNPSSKISSGTQPPPWRDERFLQWLGQLLALAFVGLLIFFLWSNLSHNLRLLGLPIGFDFLNYQAGFSIGETAIDYRPTYSYWRALFVGLVNSLRVIGCGIVLATAIGLGAGLARLSGNWLLRQLGTIYVELLRNMPLLLQLLFWYFAIFLSQKQGISILGFSLKNTGLQLPGGLELSPEFSALVLGLSVYTGTFIAEIVRGGIQSVPRGQWEAARALGLKPGLILRLVILPQALRAIIPPLGNQYLNLAKNSSLALAVGYPDLYSVASTAFNQTGRALEVMILIIASYLAISLLISLGLNLYNRSVQLPER